MFSDNGLWPKYRHMPGVCKVAYYFTVARQVAPLNCAPGSEVTAIVDCLFYIYQSLSENPVNSFLANVIKIVSPNLHFITKIQRQSQFSVSTVPHTPFGRAYGSPKATTSIGEGAKEGKGGGVGASTSIPI